MTLRCCFGVILILSVISCSGCNVSLQSSQYALVKKLLKADPPAPKKNWQLTWGKHVHLVYAVNHSDGIYFANENGVLVKFDGSQVTSLTLPSFQNKKVVQISSKVLGDGTISLQFQNEYGLSTERHICSSWQLITPQGGLKGWDQECTNNSKKYTNEIRANDQGQIVALKHVVVPGVHPAIIAQRF